MSNPLEIQSASGLMPSPEERRRLRRYRAFKDSASRYGVTGAGLAVVFSLGLIFFYLFSEIVPLFRSASVDVTKTYSASNLSLEAEDKTVYLSLERYEEIGAVFKQSGKVSFFNVDKGNSVLEAQIPRATDAQFSSLATGAPDLGLIAYAYTNGQVSVVKANYNLSYPNDQRSITPSVVYPLGEAPIHLDEQAQVITHLAVQETSDGVVVSAVTADKRLLLGVFISEENFMTGETSLTQEIFQLPPLPQDINVVAMQIDQAAEHLVVATENNKLFLYKIANPSDVHRHDPVSISGGKITALQFLVGTSSLIVGTDQGQLSQWFLVRDSDNVVRLTPVREFNSLPSAVVTIAPEFSRRGFWAGDNKGNVGIFYATSQRNLLVESFSKEAIAHIAVSPIYDRVLISDTTQKILVGDVWNKHPEVSVSSLWSKVWYEGREAPDYIWQASSGSDSFEAKMSFIPLTLGTLKAALFAILFAVPLGVMGAIYTAYFMTPRLRGIVKPSIEIMAALPTVILGFLAGLWLAPFVENHLPAVFSILILLPAMMLLVGFSWSRLPEALRVKVPVGWEAIILVIPILLTISFCVILSPQIEVWFFDGSMRQWFTNQGVEYDQRNAMVVGIIMGFAVIPTIFTIAEDAVFSVPKHLTQGSLALGATPWQTVVGVVLPTASPGIFSAVMMGFGRAVGETMIVLMATGNSPVVNFNIFEGMRTLSANIAVELPETAVSSTHFRVLFLAALVLLTMTFIVNTLAEVVRQRLRKRYSNL
jgi:phosphate transport system permease protein